MTVYNKLVRDKIPQIMVKEGLTCKFHQLGVPEFEQVLRVKLQEELDEFLKDDRVEELADLIEVIFSVAGTKGVSEEDLLRLRERKLERAGSFTQRYFLASSD